MIPGVNPRQMQQMMKKMGMKQSEIDAQEVIIQTAEHTIRLTNPQVTKVNMMGQETYQITGEEIIEEHSSQVEISQEDIQTVIDQTHVSEEVAQKALSETNGDIAEAILKLTEQ